MKADDLVLFCDVVELGSFSRAAEVHNLTNSVVSKRIGKLEQTLDVQLLYRSTRKLRMSEAGQKLLEHAQRVKQATSGAEEAVRDLGQTVTGQIKMSVPTISGELVLAEAVADFCRLHPGLHVDMSLENRFVDLFDEGMDLVIRTGYLEDSSMIARHLIDAQWIVCASPLYLSSKSRPRTPQQLTEHNCLLYTYQATGSNEWAFKDHNSPYAVVVNGNFSTNNAGVLKRAAIAGHGIVYIPRCLVYNELQRGELVDLFPTEVAKKLGIYAAYPYTKQPLKKITLLIEHIRLAYQKIAHTF
ncbi:LysR family transcriptional regulator [Vibrio ulleungensis]|uniref:LysR family transcriptional regulator n=1 Tax=Vibrio ulleungensis TaxID=2807619 RepID=A0ABS2HJA9_9VIBR|nr:LysR family transcriptional regulator [Vibrio ulleungensis]MBM7037196.1 LysR family transcriptional regulator [Vibrio ulleungensis]